MRYLMPFLFASLALPAWAEAPKVVTDLPPVQSLVAQVMDGIGTPALLMDKGADAHSFQLRPSQARALADADLVVWVGPEMTPWLDRAMTGLADGKSQLDLLHANGTQTRLFADAEDDHGTAGHDHAHEGTDPHAWLNPNNAEVWLQAISAELSRIDPDNAARYAANTAKAQGAVKALDAEIATLVAPIKDKPFLVFHDAYGYFTDHYGLRPALSIAAGDAAPPGAAHVAEVRDLLAKEPSVCLFPEAQHDPAMIEQLAEETGATVGAPLDPEGNSLSPGPDAYASLMRGLANSLVACLDR